MQLLRGELPWFDTKTHTFQFLGKLCVALGGGQGCFGLRAGPLVVIVVVTFIHKHKGHPVLGVEPPVAKPTPQVVVAVDGFYLLIVRRFEEKAAYLLSSVFVFVASSAACASAALHLFSVSLTPSPIGFIESAS